MDIRKLAVEETSTLHLHDGNDEPIYADGDESKPVRVVLYGPGSKTYKAAESKRNARAMERFRKKNQLKLSPEAEAKERAIFLVACTKSFENLSYDDLKGDALFEAVYTDSTLGFIPQQVETYLGDWGNFTKGSKKS